MLKPAKPAEVRASSGVIRLRLREVSQLFNTMDPSPLAERDLEPRAEEFILDWARELRPDQPLRLVIHLPGELPPDQAADVRRAVAHHFESQAEGKRRELRLLLREGRRTLLTGLVFLGLCLALSQSLPQLVPTAFSTFFEESLLIAGWVAMWRPLEIYLYDWWPLRAYARRFQRLAAMPVEIGTGS